MLKTAARICVIAAAASALAACAEQPPAGPSFVAQPGNGKTYQQFAADDVACRQRASAANGGVSPSQGATQSGVGTAAVGTLLGAAAGAAIGAAAGNAGLGAAAGAGAGLLGGSAVGASNAEASGYSLQRNYDITYAQCMAATGNKVPDLNAVAYAGQPAYGYPAYPAYAYPAYPYPAYGYPAYPAYPVYPAAPVVVAPSIGFGFGFGGGHWHHW